MNNLRKLQLVLIYATIFGLTGCSTYPRKRVGKIHDYQFNNATAKCKNHAGLHYIVELENTKDRELKCDTVYYARCQNGMLMRVDYMLNGSCAVSELQLQETLEEVKIREKYAWPEMRED